eukprot:12655-Pleurochrysis_carterae.AAC.1
MGACQCAGRRSQTSIDRSRARRGSARPALSVEKATSPPSPLKRALRAASFNSGGVDSVEATSATFATAVGERPSRDCFPLTRRGQSLCQCWPWHQRHLDHLTDHDSPA